jgi:hypothetical protein
MRRLNVVGPTIRKLRFQRDWTQDVLVARMQCRGVEITRDILASIETCRTKATDVHLLGFQRVFQVRIIRLFPQDIQELDEELGKRERPGNRPPDTLRRRKP